MNIDATLDAIAILRRFNSGSTGVADMLVYHAIQHLEQDLRDYLTRGKR